VTNDYYMDPDGRVRETITGSKKAISHYDGPGEAVAWTCEGAEKAETCESSGKWTRDVPGIDGTLTAVENGKGATVETSILQLHDLEGDVAATVKDKAGETKLESTYNSTEFGVPNGGKEPPKFAWLGAGGVEKSLASGVVTEGATSYVPQTGRALQSEEVAPPGLPGGSGGQAANFTASPWNLQGAERVGAEAPGLEAGREEEAAAAALAACGMAGSCDPPRTLYFDAREVAVFTGLLNAQEIALSGWDALEKIGITVDDFAKDEIEKVIEKSIGIHTPGEWSESITQDFNACLGVMDSGYRGQNLTYVRCAITTPWLEETFPIIGKVEVPDFFGMPSASYCLYYAGHCGAYDEGDNLFVFPSGRSL
jgi:hypothetical protein